jgi:deferrochelatase/peroxidase EfeB
MHREIVVKGRSLGGSSDLTLLAPIKAGFVDALDTVTYKTRIKRVLEALHGARTLAHEYVAAPLLSDSVERVGAIQSVRVAVLEPEDKVLLAVTFDGPWEAYIRVLWDKVGTLLDLIFVDTVDYVTAFDHSFDAWRAWGRRVQVETGFFYGPTQSTARDALYWRRVERMRERDPAPLGPEQEDQKRWRSSQVNELRASLPPAEAIVDKFVAAAEPETADEPVYAQVMFPRMVHERVRHGLRALAVLYRLTDLFRPGTREGDVLRRAALDLLREFVATYGDGAGVAKDQIREARDGEDPLAKGRGRFARQLNWLLPEGQRNPMRTLPADPGGAPIDLAVLAAIQGGIVRPYEDVTHGVVLFLCFEGLEGAHRFLDGVRPMITPGNHEAASPDGDPFCNVAFTLAGLRAAGLSEDDLELFPEEFRMGMARRAGLLGDVRNNHPLRWRFPPVAGDVAGAEPDMVHAALILRCMTKRETAADATVDISDADHPLRTHIDHVVKLGGARVAAIQSMKRLYADPERTVIREHFGYHDGNGQPTIEQSSKIPPFRQNLIHLGEVLVGRTNASDPEYVDDSDAAADIVARMAWLGNGSFLVMRKYRQYVNRLRAVVAATAVTLPGGATESNTDLVYAKLMGRYLDGTPVIDPPNSGVRNNFIYENVDPGLCPVTAHIRLANPRPAKRAKGEAGRMPRVMRRSMSYGPTFDSVPSDDIDRGLVFMAFCASLSEQYEVIQRWLNGGNPSGASSGQNCPFVGVPENGVQKTFRFEYDDPALPGVPGIAKVELGPNPQLFEEPPVLTQLDWGVYTFMPSLAVLDRIRAVVSAAVRLTPASSAPPWDLSRGRKILGALERVRVEQGDEAATQAWKAVIEDPESIDRLDAAAAWAAIRSDHAGLLKTPYGTLVASRDLLCEVLRDQQARYTVSGQFARMTKSFGGVALGLDASPEYWAQSDPVNNAIHALTNPAPKVSVYQRAFDAARGKINFIVTDAQKHARTARAGRFDVGLDAREVVDEVLASLSEHWFGLQMPQAQAVLARGSVDWTWKVGEKPLYPGHFTALSRYMFQPNPGNVPVELGQAYGVAFHEAMLAFVNSVRQGGPAAVPEAPDGDSAPIAAAIFNHPSGGADNDFVARTMVGVLMGFTPTIIGAVLNVLREWFGAGSFNGLRAQLALRTDEASVREVILAPMSAAARMRPMPQIGWRTVRVPHRLGPPGACAVDLEANDKIVLAFVSGTQQSLADGGDSQDRARLMFGGARTWDGAREHPTHACPGFEAGIQAMLGTLGALLSYPSTLRAGVSATSFSIEGEVPQEQSPPALDHLALLQLAVTLETHFAKTEAAFSHPKDGDPKMIAKTLKAKSAIRSRPPVRTGHVIGWGDSWLDYRLPVELGGLNLGSDLRDVLAGFKYTAPPKFCAWQTWTTIEQMASGTDAFGDWLTTQVQTIPKLNLRAILLSGGGNDVVGNKLQKMLAQWPVPATGPFVPDLIDSCMDELAKHYTTVIAAVLKTLDDLALHGFPAVGKVQVIIHGYDYPYPRGESPVIIWPLKDWLVVPFTNAGYLLDQPAHFKAAVDAMRVLMERLRKTLATVAAAFPGRVRQVDLLGTIEECWPNDPMSRWANDLHPKDDAYEQLAIRIDDAIVASTWP